MDKNSDYKPFGKNKKEKYIHCRPVLFFPPVCGIPGKYSSLYLFTRTSSSKYPCPYKDLI